MRMELASIARTNRKPIAGVEPFGQQTLHFNIKLYRQTRTTDFFLTAIRCRHHERKSIGMGASYRAKRIGRADQARQLPGSADPPRELFLTRRSFCAISRRDGFAHPQLQRIGSSNAPSSVLAQLDLNEAPSSQSAGTHPASDCKCPGSMTVSSVSSPPTAIS